MSEVKNTPNGWVETTLGNSINLIGGGTPNTSTPEYWGGEIPWLSVVDFNDDNRWVYSAEKSITELGLKKSSTKLLNIGDIIISARGTVGAMAQLKKEMAFNQSCYGIKEKENISDINFIFYLLKYSLKQINRNTYGAVFDTITTKTFDIINIILPLIPEQKSIASILTSFDNKIELLQAQNKTLETTAQTIFSEWFGKYSVDDELPDGWSVEELDELLELIIDYRGKTPLKLGLDWSENGIPAISAKSIKNGKIVRRDAMNFGSEELYSIWMKDELKKGDILLTSEAPLGEMYYINDDTRYILSQRVFALRVNQKITSEYLFHYLFSANGQTLLQARASGSTVEGIRQSELRKIEIIVPKKDILDNASKILKTAFDKIFTNEEQIQTLIKTRDELLPRLMSGEVRVNEFKV